MPTNPGETQPLLLAPPAPDDDHGIPPATPTYGGGTAPVHTTRITTSRLRIASMCCPREGELVQELLLGPVAGVLDVRINNIGRVAVVRHTLPATTAGLLKALNAAHLGASVQDVAEGEEQAHGAAAAATNRNGKGNNKDCIAAVLRAWGPLLAAGVGLALALAGAHAHWPRPRVAWLAALLPCVVAAALPMGPGLLRAARRRRVDMNVLMAAAAGGALLLGDVAEAMAVLLVVQLAERARAAADARVARSLDAAGAGMAPLRARVLDPEREEFPREVDCDAVAVGEVVLVRAGEKAPVDGEVVRGEALLDEAALTGECMPVPKRFGDFVHGGSVCQAGALRVRCTAPAAQSGAQAVRALVQDVAATKPPAQELLDWFAGWYSRVILTLAGAALAAPAVGWAVAAAGASQASSPFPGPEAWRAALYRGIELLVLACPCALAVAAPLPFLTALAASTRQGTGVLFRSAAALEALGRVNVVALDKTGTLTEGRFRVTGRRRLAATARLEEGLVRRLAASVEAVIAHRLAAAVVLDALGCVTEAYYDRTNGGNRGNGSRLAEVTGLTSLEGVGVEGECTFASASGADEDETDETAASVPAVRTYRVAVGNERLLKGAAGAAGAEAAAFMAAHRGQVHLFVVVDGVPELALALADEPRAEAVGMLRALRGMGIAAAMLTGDSPGVAAAVEGRLREGGEGRLLDEVVARMKPADKLRWVQARQAKGKGEEVTVKEAAEVCGGGCCGGCGDGGEEDAAAAALEAGKGMMVVVPPARVPDKRQKKRKQGRLGAAVAMVGDGVNDGPALAACDAGVAMGGHGTALAVESAGVVLLGDDLRRLPQAVLMARCVRRVVWQNVAWAVGPKLVFLGLLAAGYGRLWMAVAADAGALVAVLLNGLRPLWLAEGIYRD